MTDRHALADALAGATGEQLREDARVLTDIAGDLAMYATDAGPFPFPPLAHRLAALALAVAEMQERGDASCHGAPPTYRVTPEGDAVWSVDAPGTTLPAALAALVREG